MTKILSIVFTVFLFTSCATLHKGKLVTSDACRKIEYKKRNTHHFKLSHVLIDYNYRVDRTKKIISIEGAIDRLPAADTKRTLKKVINSDFYVLENKTLKQCYVDFFLLDGSRKVVSVHRVPIPHSSDIQFPMPFKTTTPFIPDYKYISLGYKFVFTSSAPRASSMEKVYTHELDIEKTQK